MYVSSLRIYPVKSLAAHTLSEASLSVQGLAQDRLMMFVSEQGRFISQREIPEMSLIKPIFEENIQTPFLQFPFLYLPTQQDHWSQLETRNVEVWGRKSQAHLIQKGMMIGQQALDLVWVGAKQAQKSFADSEPILLLNENSYEAFVEKAGFELDINRFRGNIFVKGANAWHEDTWKFLRIGHTDFEVIKPCSRCQLINVNQETAQINTEVLKQLAQIRLIDKKIRFGVLIKPIMRTSASKTLKVGDSVQVLESASLF